MFWEHVISQPCAKCMYQCVAIIQRQFWCLGIVLAHVCLCVYQWIYWYCTILIVFSGIQCLQYLLCTAGFLSYGTPGQTGEGVEKQWNHVILVILRWMFGMWKHEMVLGCVIPSGKWYCVHRGRQEPILMVLCWFGNGSWRGLWLPDWKYFNSSPLNKMATILQKITLNAFSWMKSFVFWLKFHWSLFLGVQLTITEHWFR